MDATSSERTRPSEYQMALLREAGIRVRPHSYESAKRRVDGLEPSPNQVALLTELGLPIPETRAAASAAITAYEEAHPDWARARRAARSEKGITTRRERQAAGQQPAFNETLAAYHETGVQRHGPAAASTAALSYLRALALLLPKDSAERLDTFRAMRDGLSAAGARTRIDALKARQES